MENKNYINQLLNNYLITEDSKKRNKYLHILSQRTGKNYIDCLRMAIETLEQNSKKIYSEIANQIGEKSTYNLMYLIKNENVNIDNSILNKYYSLGHSYVKQVNKRLEAIDHSGHYDIKYDEITCYEVKDLCCKLLKNQATVERLKNQINKSESICR